jgi:predicted ribosome quality control (RQC) complex YloA/Tae2 family protein
MEKIDVTSTVFRYIVKNLSDELVGGYINNIQSIDEDTFKIKVHKKKTKQLIVNPKLCFLSDYVLPTNETKGLVAYLKKTLLNQRIHEINQDKNNRVVYFKLDKFYLILEFFSKSNLILTDLDFKIITSKQKEEWKDRLIQKGQIYKFPTNTDIKILEDAKIIKLLEEDLAKRLGSLTKKELITYLVKKYNLPPSDIEIVVGEKEKISKETIKNIKEIYNYENPRLVILDGNKNKMISVVNEEGKLYDELEKYYLEVYKDNTVEVQTTKQNKNKVILTEQLETKTKFEDYINKLNKEGELIYSYFTYIDQINKQIEIATTKKINELEIIKIINGYLDKSKVPIKIISINQKNKTYIADFK